MFTLVTMSGTAVSRCLAYSLPTTDMAQSLGPAALLLFILSACYSPQYLDLPSWLRWLAWISPCAYCYEGVIVSETAWRTVGNTNGQVFAQAVLGIPRVAFDAAPSALSNPGGVIAFDVYMLICLTIVLEVIGCCLLHQSQKWYGPSTLRYQVASGQSLSAPPWKGVHKKTSEDTIKSAIDMANSPDADSSGVPQAPPAHLMAKSIVYEVDVDIDEDEGEKNNETEGFLESATDDDTDNDYSVGTPRTAREYGQTGNGMLAEYVLTRQLGDSALRISSMKSSASMQQRQLDPPEPGRLRLLSGITASFEPGTLNALMGESGAGKTTLLDAIAGYKTSGHLSGDIKVNGVPKNDEIWRSIAGYCEQVDLHNPSMTVRESLIFAARMRLRPFSLADDKKVHFATKILHLLELDDFADMLVGDEASGEGIPKHARKRLTVGVELAANPSILFADEPTSGLDSLSAAMVVSSLKKAAKIQGLTVVCTIHQPSREVFLAFDNLLLLKKGGRCVFNGPITSLNDYLSTAGDNYAVKKEVNIADHALDVFCGPLGVGMDWVELYKKSSMCKRIGDTVQSCSCPSCETGEISVDATPQSFSSELFLVWQRQIIAHWRTTTYMALRFWWTVIACFIVGLVFFDSGNGGNFSTTVGALFFFINIATVPLLSAMVPLITERSVFYRETLSGTYSGTAYGAAVQLAEIPFNLGFGLVSFVIFYFMVGLSMEGERIVYFILMTLASYWILPAFGQLLAFVSPNTGAAVGVGSLLMTLFTLTMGFLLIPKDIPPWYIWLYWINPLRYVLQGLVVSEFGGQDPTTDEMLADNFSWSYDDRWWYCYVVTLFFGAAAFLGTVLATRISWLKR